MNSINIIDAVKKSGLVLAGCALLCPAAFGEVMDGTAATVNGKPVFQSEYNRNVDAIKEQYQRFMPEFFQQPDANEQIEKKVLEQMVDDILLQQYAEKMKLKVRDRELDNGVAEVKKSKFSVDENGKPRDDSEVDALFAKALNKESLTLEQFRDRLRKQLLVRKVIEEVVRPKVAAPTDKDIQACFDKIKFIVKGDTSVVKGMSEEDAQDLITLGQRFKDMTAERVRVRHLLVKVDPGASMADKSKALEKAQGFKKQLDKGDDFAELARKSSDDPESAARGGDIGFVVKGMFPALPEFENKAFSLGVGETSDPFETKFGYHIMRVEEKKAAQGLSYDDAKEDIGTFLMNQQLQKELLKLVKDLRDKADISYAAKK